MCHIDFAQTSQTQGPSWFGADSTSAFFESRAFIGLNKLMHAQIFRARFQGIQQYELTPFMLESIRLQGPAEYRAHHPNM